VNVIRRFLTYVALALLLSPSAPAAEPIKLKLAFQTSDSSNIYKAAIKPFVDAVNAEGKGVVEIEVYFSGALGKTPLLQWEALGNGTADIAFVIPGQIPGRFPDSALIELPGLFRNMREASLVFTRMSPAQFASGRVSEIVAEALRGSGLDARRLEIEITESLLLADSNGAMNELTKLKAMGVAIVMDDFGTGYSSLSYLWRFPFDKIKIDRSFMLGLDRSGRDAETVVKTIVALGRELGMRVTVEGVEKASQATFLEGFDSDQAQGFFFGRPVPASEIKPELLAHLQPTAETRKAGA